MAQNAAVGKPTGLPRKIASILRDGLEKGGITAEVKTQAVPGTKLYRVWATAPEFKSLKPSERQSLAWRILDMRLDPDEQLRISMMYTLTPDEAAGRWN